MTRKLRVFLCHASQDKPAVRGLYKRLAAEPWIDPWLDEEKLLPGQDFDLEIYKAARESDSIIICLSTVSVVKEGYVNREIRRALDAADEKPEGAIYIIPLRLDDCTPSFERLKQLHYADYFTPNAHEKLIRSLRLRADALKIETVESSVKPISQPAVVASQQDIDLDLYRFIQIPATEEVPYSFYIGKYPVTNAQYERFLSAPDFGDETLWKGFPKFNEDFIQIGKWESEGWDWFLENSNENKKILPRSWSDSDFGLVNPENPVVEISWFESNAYCIWLLRHWDKVLEGRANINLHPRLIRLPVEPEWITAAGGEEPKGRYPWDLPGKTTMDTREIAKRANVVLSNINRTTPVNAYLRGVSSYGVMDLAGNVWELQANYRWETGDVWDWGKGYMSPSKNLVDKWFGLRGGSWANPIETDELGKSKGVSNRDDAKATYSRLDIGFRVVATIPNM